MAIQTTVLSTATSTIYLSAGNSAITTAYICNKTASTVTVNVYIVPQSISTSSNNLIYSQLSIAGNDTYVMELERILLSNGDSIVADSTANNAVISTISYTGI